MLRNVNGAALAAGTMTATKVMTGIGLWGLIYLTSQILTEIQNYFIYDWVTEGTKKLYDRSFQHIHKLDLGYHKAKSKSTVFEINKAMRSLDIGLYYFCADIVKYAFRLLFIVIGISRMAGAGNTKLLLGTFISYFLFTVAYSGKILKLFRKDTDLLKKSEEY